MLSKKYLGLACIMMMNVPVLAKSPLKLFVDGAPSSEVQIESPVLKIINQVKPSEGKQKSVSEAETIGDEQIANLISFLNDNKSLVLKNLKSSEEVGKLYFNPQFDKNKKGKVFLSNGSGAVRLQQSLYYRDDSGKTHHVPFEGAEVVVYIKNEGENRSFGNITSINSSLINSKKYETKVSLLKDLNDGSFSKFKNLSTSQRDEFLKEVFSDDQIVDQWESVAKSIYPDEKLRTKKIFLERARQDSDFIVKFLKKTGAVELVFSSKDGLNSFQLVYKVSAPFAIPKVLKLNVDHEELGLFHQVSHLDKHVTVNIWRGSLFKLKKSKKRSAESSKAKDFEIDRGLFRQEDYDLALINISKVVEEFKTDFKWNGFDNKGSAVDATVRYKGSRLLGTNVLRQNAAWIGSPYNQFIFGRGGDDLDNFLEAFDVIGHEYCHAIVSHTANLDYAGESGALNEHVCDILGVGVESNILKRGYDFKIGEVVMQQGDKALRDFLIPQNSASPQAIHMSQVNDLFGDCEPSEENDSCGVHISNGVTNQAIGHSIKAIGWDRMKEVVFDTVSKRLRSSSNFLDYRRQIIASCMDNSKITERECNKIKTYFDRVGVKEVQ